MFRPTIVIWLVLLVLALNVVAFATRILEKCRLIDRSSKSSETTISIITEQGAGDVEGSTDPTHAPIATA